MAAGLHVRAGLVVDGEALDHGCARFVKADDLDLGAFAPELDHCPVERSHGRDVPEMGFADIDDDPVQYLPEVEGFGEPVGGREE